MFFYIITNYKKGPKVQKLKTGNNGKIHGDKTWLYPSYKKVFFSEEEAKIEAISRNIQEITFCNKRIKELNIRLNILHENLKKIL